MMQQADRQRLTHIYEYCVSIEKAIQRFGSDFQSFDCDEDFQHSLSFCLLQIGELGGDLSEEYRRETANRVQWGPMKAMRNMVAHGYGKMDRRIIWETVTTDIPVLKAVCEEQLTFKTFSAMRKTGMYFPQGVASPGDAFSKRTICLSML